MRVVGVDPGANTGLVVVDYIGDKGHLLATATIRRSKIKGLSRVEEEFEHFTRLRQFFNEYDPELVVLEDPFDISDGWGAGGRRRGTAYRLGASYGLALAASPPLARRVTYPVQGHTKEPGWQGRGTKGARVLRYSLAFRQLRNAPLWTDLDEHVQMAACVLLHHTTNNPPSNDPDGDADRKRQKHVRAVVVP